MTTNSLAGGNMQASRPSKCKNGRFVYCIQNKWLRPHCHSQMALPLREKKKKKIAEPVTRNNVLAWRQPFCTTSGGTDRHREALALSWHRPDPRLRVVTDSQVGACQAWRLALLTSVHTISRPLSVAGPRTLTLGSLTLLLNWPKPPTPLLLCSHLALFPWVLLWGYRLPF